MKITKILILSAALLSGTVFAQNSKFITNQTVDDNITIGSATGVHSRDLLRADYNCTAAQTIALTYADGATVENWTFGSTGTCNAIWDKFLVASGGKAQGNPLYYVETYGSNAKSVIPYDAMRKVVCVKTNASGGDFYTATITLKTGAVVTASGYSITKCAYPLN